MLDGMLDAFDCLIQHFVQRFICGHAHYAPKVDILSSEHHIESFSVVCILNQQFTFLGCSTSILIILNVLLHRRMTMIWMLLAMLDEMLDAFDHPPSGDMTWGWMGVNHSILRKVPSPNFQKFLSYPLL